MEDGVLTTLGPHLYRFHEPMAGRFTIARVHVDVFAPQTLRTMVGVPTATHKETTPFAGEVFPRALKFLRGGHTSPRFWVVKDQRT